MLIALAVLGTSCGHVERKAATPPEPEKRPSLLISNLRDLTQLSVLELMQTVDTEDVYIIVHPSYYVFFHKKGFEILPQPGKNAVGSFLDQGSSEESSVVQLMREYERAEMEFLLSVRNSPKLVILIIPGNYMNINALTGKNGTDYYAAYLNAVTEGTNSVFYIQSKKADSGKIRQDDLIILDNFLTTIGAKNIFLGGGYVGRCQEEFSETIEDYWSRESVAIIPELSALSPDDISESTAKMLLTPELRLNIWAVNYFIRNGGLKSLKSRVNIKNISDIGLAHAAGNGGPANIPSQ